MDIVTRAAEIFDRVIVAVADSRSALFSTDERQQLFADAVEHAGLHNVRVISFTGLTVDVARENGVHALVRGLRAITDFSAEFDMALMNRKMAPDVESVYLMTALEHLFISGSRIRELAGLGHPIDDLVPPGVAEALAEKFKNR